MGPNSVSNTLEKIQLAKGPISEVRKEMDFIGESSLIFADNFSMAFSDTRALKDFGDAFKNLGDAINDTLRSITRNLIRMATIEGIATLLTGPIGLSKKGVGAVLGTDGGFDGLRNLFPKKSRSAGAGKIAISNEVVINGIRLQTEQSFTKYRASQLGF